MNNSYITKCKDTTPEYTINRIRNILNGIGILTREDWRKDIDGYYSVMLSVIGTAIFSNGKGTSYEYALASAYGELVERLQNMTFMRFNRGMSKKALAYRDFCYAPDEKAVGVEELSESEEKWLGTFTFEASGGQEKKDLLKKWLSADDLGRPDDFLAVPYLNVTTGSLCHIPMVMILSRYGTNGMCAGNSAEEALVQGISETIERYVGNRIHRDKIVPPTVPESFLSQHYPYYFRMIGELEKRSGLKIIVKDCSLGEGYPAVGIIAVDARNHSYFIKFGAHPQFEIALERCLTEFLQGKEVKSLSDQWMSRFSYCNEETFSFKNLWKISVYGKGYYPVEIFSEDFSYEFFEPEDMKDYGNREMLHYLVKLLEDKGFEILIRDVSFLDFPSFHVIVPYFSELNDSNLQIIERVSARKKAAGVLMNLKKADGSELQEVVNYFSALDCSPKDSITLPLHLSLGTAFVWNNIKRDLFACSVYYKMRNYKKAYDSMDCFINSESRSIGEAGLTYYSCIRDYVGAIADGIENENRISGMLKKFYRQDTVDKVMTDMRDPDNVFRNCEGLDCFDCSKCGYVGQCSYLPLEKVYMQLKDKYAENVIRQERNRELFTQL